MSRTFVAHLILSIVVAHVSADSGSSECPPNSELKQCGTLCEPTCSKPDTVYCNPKDPDSCEDECRCDDGYVRNEDKDDCIKPSECPYSNTTTTNKPTTENPTTETPTPKPSCGYNESLALCGILCEPSCSNKKPNSFPCPRIECTKITEDCRCEDGYYRTIFGKCVLEKDCPIQKITTTTDHPITPIPTTKPDCGCNETLNLCGTICEPTCANMKPNTMLCSLIPCTRFTQGCRCKNGYYRNLSNECVLTEDCSQGPIKPAPCGDNEELGACGRACEGTCKNPINTKCNVMRCLVLGCRCKGGYVRDEKTDKCVPIGMCTDQKCEPDNTLRCMLEAMRGNLRPTL